MDEFLVYHNEAPCGTVRMEPRGLYTLFAACCGARKGRLYSLVLEGEKGSVLLGVPEWRDGCYVLHRLLANLEPLMRARVVIAVAGMEGALASVVGGLVDCPVIAVPTSVGYGASFGGVSALLSMLNSCASGVSVVNIDNGFGAGFLASRINQMEGIKDEHPVSGV